MTKVNQKIEEKQVIENKVIHVKEESIQEKTARLRKRVAAGKKEYANLEKYKKDGLEYRFANTSKDEHLYYQDLGYTPVYDEHGSTITVNAGAGEHQIMMCIPKEDKKILDQVKRERVLSRTASLNNKEANQYGSITVKSEIMDVKSSK